MFKLPGFSRDDACTPQSAATLSALNNTVDYILRADVIFKISIKPHYFDLDYQDRGRESYGPDRNLLDRRFSFCYRVKTVYRC